MIKVFRSKGFTMIELTAALAVLGLIALFAIPKVEEEWAERIVNNAASQVHDVLTAARRHRLDTQAWPNNVGALVSGGYLSSSMAAAPLGGSYTFNHVGDDFEVQFSAAQSVYANRLLARLPYARRIGVANVATVIPIPGHEVSYAALDDKYYHRDGSRELTGTFAGGDQDAVNLRNIEMTMLTDRDDITKILDPSDRSFINDLTARDIGARDITATSVDADYVEADALNITRTERENTRCTPTTTGNLAIDQNDGRSLLLCDGGYWRAKQGDHKYHSISPSTLYSSGAGIGVGTIYRSAPDFTNATYSALQLRLVCNTNNDSDSNSILIDGDTVHTSYAYDAQIVTTTVFTLSKGPGERIRIRGGQANACDEGIYIFVMGYWGVAT